MTAASPELIDRANAALDKIDRAAPDAAQLAAIATFPLSNRAAHRVLERWLARRGVRGKGSWRLATTVIWIERIKLRAVLQAQALQEARRRAVDRPRLGLDDEPPQRYM